MQWLHKTIGLILGAWLMLMGVSGAVLSFYPEIDSALNLGQLRVAQSEAQPDIDALVKVVGAAYPDRTILSAERYGVSDHESLPFFLSAQRAGGPRAGHDPELEVFVDPHTHAILGERGYWTWFRILRSFHMELLFAGTGERVVGVLGLFLLTTTIVGTVLWQRESRGRLGAALRPRLTGPRPMVYRSIHTVGGVYVALFLVIQALSGALVADLFPVQTWIGKLFSAAPTRAMPPPPAKPTGPMISADRARDIALARHPDSTVIQIVFPSPGFNLYSVRLFPKDQPKTRFTRQFLINPASGQVVLAFDPTLQGPVRKIFGAWMIWIHNGRFFGLAGQVILVVTGTMLSLLFPTGLYMWLRKRKFRLARQARAAA